MLYTIKYELYLYILTILNTIYHYIYSTDIHTYVFTMHAVYIHIYIFIHIHTIYTLIIYVYIYVLHAISGREGWRAELSLGRVTAKSDSVPKPPSYPLTKPKYHQKRTIRAVIEAYGALNVPVLKAV